MDQQNCSLKRKLKAIVKAEPHSLRAAVAREALGYDGNLVSFFSDLQNHGCQSGMISSLIYYYDTHCFYDAHYDEIEALRFELEESIGELLYPKGDLKNWFAWMAFEETANNLFNDLFF